MAGTAPSDQAPPHGRRTPVPRPNAPRRVVTSAHPRDPAQSVTFTATIGVQGPGTTAVAFPGGTVTVFDNGVSIGTGSVSTTSGVTTATFSTTLGTGNHPITARYSGDTNFVTSTSAAIT